MAPTHDLPPGTRLRPPRLREVLRLSMRRLRGHRIHGPLCPRCLYDVRGLSDNSCPECGAVLVASGVIGPRVVGDYVAELRRRRSAGVAVGIGLVVVLLIFVATPRLVKLLATWEHAIATEGIGYVSPGNLGITLTAEATDFTSRPWRRYPRAIDRIDVRLGGMWAYGRPRPAQRNLSPGEPVAVKLHLDPAAQELHLELMEHQRRAQSGHASRDVRVLPLTRDAVVEVLHLSGFDTGAPAVVADVDHVVALLRHACTLHLGRFSRDVSEFVEQQMAAGWRFGLRTNPSPWVRGQPSTTTSVMPWLINTGWIVLGVLVWRRFRRGVQPGPATAAAPVTKVTSVDR